ncbi:hypothetical protein BDZ85DRAFT_6310 [Elsinoe ampelina]|uniref:Uncharacterized protein n=1 Tax=Elsinoe ampelina TaxID=302913 RepID=A0A6A6GPL6_9PEZI|nr:hypothetical protein BDZ85DRAFT_6310 [Elsinoe ampelina]
MAISALFNLATLSRGQRVGLYGIRGPNEPRHATTGTDRVPSNPTPIILMPVIERLLKTGQNTYEPFWGFNDVSLRTSMILSSLRVTMRDNQLDSPASAYVTDCTVGEGVSRTSYRFSRKTVSGPSSTTSTVCLSICIFDSLDDPVQALASELTR